ncbi:Metallo-beta-lactamase superfamily protein [Mycena sanguinolenta]|uniref:Metallo-beta-lactamase superfamily protein n=1 Tax=Mycena sanguinolenta TaxID=230812 RepID=A0A8H6ZJ04_9AGAR|nr:Metallo-beta-lactamase superfamily protein [Mycena sanguinolenta]
MSKFPNATGLLIGSETNTATYPETANASLQTSDFAGHVVNTVDFGTAELTFSGLKAIDYFGDGSFYLLNTPGFLEETPFTTPVRPDRGQTFKKNFPCPAHLLEEVQSSVSTDYFWSPLSREHFFNVASRAQPLLAISDIPGSVYSDPVTSQVSLDKIATFDADPDFFVVTAHDMSVLSYFTSLPASLDGWKADGLKQRTVWNFVDKLNPAFVFSPTNVTS